MSILIVVLLSIFLGSSQIKVQALDDSAPASFDWRNVHGKNWISPLRDNPNKNGCFADASTGLLETSINLYYNRLFDLDLSEQAGRDCYYDSNNTIPALTNSYNPDPSCPTDGSQRSLFARRALNAGVFDEACDPFRNEAVTNNACSSAYICSDWQSRVWKPSDYMELFTARTGNFDIGYLGYDNYYGDVTELQCSGMLAHAQYIENEEDFKKALIRNGPMHAVVDSWGHEMLLVGYYTAKDWETVDYCSDRMRGNGFCSADGCDNFSADCDASLLGVKTCYQKDLYECIQTEDGDYLLERNPNVCDAPSCSITELGTSKCLNDGIYVCTDNGLYSYWERTSNCSGICVNNQCVSSDSTFNPGDKRCLRNGGDNHYVYQEFTPGSTETYWTYKNQNQGGAVFGDHGFISIIIPYSHLISGVYFIGPYTAPTNSSYIPANFDGTIKCEDLDNDSYCNWGISQTKPATCAATCNVKKDCDDSNPELTSYDENMNCTSNIDLGITASASRINGSTFDISITVNNSGSNATKDVTLSFIKGYDLIVAASGFSCTVNEAEYRVNCAIPPIAPGALANGTIRMTSLDPGSRYDLSVSSGTQVDVNPANNSAVVNLSNPIQQCEVTYKGITSVQDCMNIDNAGTYYTTRGDLIRMVCTSPDNTLATGCTLHFQIQNMMTGLKVVDALSGSPMLWGQGGTDNNSPKLLILSDSNTPIGEIMITLEDNLDWSAITAGTDSTTFKTFVHNLTVVPGATSNFSLFIPFRNNDTGVGICPGAASLSAIDANCAGLIIKHEADADTDIVTLNGSRYWKVSGLTGTGGYSIQGSLLTRTGDSMLLPLIIGFNLFGLVLLKHFFSKR